MKIALTGAHGVGKSTLAENLKSLLEEKVVITYVTPEVPRLICHKLGDLEYFRRENNSLLKQSLIMLGQLVIENGEDFKFDCQICDRTLFDHWAYTLSLFSEEIIEGKYLDIYESFIAKHCATYDYIFYIPIEFKPLDDGIRESDEKFQNDIDNLITNFYSKYNIEIIKITGSIIERSNKIIGILNNK